MAQDTDLELFAFDDLLVVWWPERAPLATGLVFRLNRRPLAKPLLAVRCPDETGYLIAAHVPELPNLKTLRLDILDARAGVIARAKAPKAQPFNMDRVALWNLSLRVRLEKALINQLPTLLPQIQAGTRLRVATALAETRVKALCFVDGGWYMRLPWPTAAEAGCIDVNFRPLLTGRADDYAVTAKALIEGEAVHLYLPSGPANPGAEPVWIIDAGQARTAPIQIDTASLLPSGASLDGALDAICADYAGDRRILRAFLETVGNTPRRRAREIADPNRLSGAIDGLADGRISGWAYDRRRPETPVTVEVRSDDRLLGTTEANLPRVEQQVAGLAHCGFVFQLPAECLSGQPLKLRFNDADTGLALPVAPFEIGRGHFDTQLNLDDAGYLTGWVRERCAPSEAGRIRLLIDGEACGEVIRSTPSRHPNDGRLEFRVLVPERYFDMETHVAAAEIITADGTARAFAQSVRFQAGYRGHIDVASSDRVAGWIVNTLAPQRPVNLELWINGEKCMTRLADAVRSDVVEQVSAAHCGFDFVLDPMSADIGSRSIELRVAGGAVPVLGPRLLYTPYDIALRSLTTLAELLNDPDALRRLSGGLAFDQDVATWARTQIVAKALDQLRAAQAIPAKIELNVNSIVGMPAHRPFDSTVDIIVPVYLGQEATRRCLESVLAARCSTPFELIVIDDASPDPEFNRELREWSDQRGFSFLVNTRNLGFVGTVNRGMRLHANRDVVLLNSDTAVADGWLDRLRTAACSAANIGTATPFSNNATICSFPVFCAENPLPADETVASLDALFAAENPGMVVDLPTAVGCCMFIKRAALDEVGYFDEAQWGKGYGEENDFCLRASNYGWRHVAACDVFIEHEGGVSFADGKQGLMARNGARLNSLYPDYSATVARFIAQDPMAPCRNRVAVQLLKRNARRYVLFVSHGLGGGVHVTVDYLATRLAEEGAAVLLLSAAGAGRYSLVSRELPYRLDLFGESGLAALGDLNIWHVHFHQTMGFPRSIFDLPARLGVQYDFTAHDYLPVCPRIDMIDESGHYCGESQFNAESCSRCVAFNGCHPHTEEQFRALGATVNAWREIYGRFLTGARRVIAPSQDVARRYAQHFGLTNLHVLPHPEPAFEFVPSVKREPFTVVVIGAIGPHKGYDTLLQCVQNAAKDGLPLRFVVIGYTSGDAALTQYGNVTITGEYRNEQLGALLNESQASVALFLSRCPETYCFTLSEAWHHGLYPVAPEIGAFIERVRAIGVGQLFPPESNGRDVNRLLLDVMTRLDNLDWPAARIGGEPERILSGYYQLDVKDAQAIGLTPRATKRKPASPSAQDVAKSARAATS